MVWDGRSDGSRIGFGDRSTGRGNIRGKCVTNGEFVVLRPLPKSLWDILFINALSSSTVVTVMCVLLLLLLLVVVVVVVRADGV